LTTPHPSSRRAPATEPPPSSLCALDHARGVVVAPVSVDVKTNEIPLFATLLDQVPDLEGTLITGDALHAQVRHLDYLHARGAHYGGPRPAPSRKVRPRSPAEQQLCALGPVAAPFITGAAATGNALAAVHGQTAFLAALGRAVAFRRWRAADARSILAAGTGTPDPTATGDALVIDLPVASGRSLAQYAPTLFVTAETERWTPEEVLRTLVEAEIGSRDASNARTRLKAAAFPVAKTLEKFDLTATVEGPPYRAPDVRNLTVYDSQSQDPSMPALRRQGFSGDEPHPTSAGKWGIHEAAHNVLDRRGNNRGRCSDHWWSGTG